MYMIYLENSHETRKNMEQQPFEKENSLPNLHVFFWLPKTMKGNRGNPSQDRGFVYVSVIYLDLSLWFTCPIVHTH